MTLTAPQQAIVTAISRGARNTRYEYRRHDLTTLRLWGLVKMRRNGWQLTAKGEKYA